MSRLSCFLPHVLRKMAGGASDIAAVDPEVGGAIAIIMFYLTQSGRAYADQLCRPQTIEFPIDQWGSAHIPKHCFCCLSDQNMKLGDIIC